MTLYIFALTLGGTGLVAMAAIGAAHLGGESGHGDVGHVGHAGHAHGSHYGHTHGNRAHGHVGGTLRSALLSLMSPRVLFSVLVGFGLTGMALQPLLPPWVVVGAAVLGAAVFEGLFVRPLWNGMFRFASRPAETLETSVLGEATAASGFDAAGQGVVAVVVDGQVVQCLGTLQDSDRALGVRVRAGDRLRVENVDAARNRCVVSYVGHEIAS